MEEREINRGKDLDRLMMRVSRVPISTSDSNRTQPSHVASHECGEKPAL
jgi:hypothetical protein